MLIIESLLVLFSAVVIFTQGGPAISGAIFIGVDTTDRSAEPVDIFKRATNHASAASSILVHKASLFDFRPSTQPVKNLGDNFRDFQSDLPNFSGFLHKYKLIAFPTFDGPFSQFEELIRDINPYGSHDELIARSLRDLLPDHIDDNEDNNWLLSLIVIEQYVDETVIAGLVAITVSLKNDKDGRPYITNDISSVGSTVFRIDKRVLYQLSELLAQEYPVVHVPEALKFFTSPQVEFDRATTPCHKKSAAYMNKDQRAIYNWRLYGNH